MGLVLPRRGHQHRVRHGGTGARRTPRLVRFRKGRHAAGLNFGDCFSYAHAKVSGEALLFKGQDFRKTGISEAL